MTDRIVISVPARATYLKHLREWCGAIMTGAGYDRGPIDDFLIALTEACANTIEHSLKMDESKAVVVEMTVYEGRIEACIRDFCRTRDLPKIKPRSLTDVRPRGLGTHFIRKTADRIDFVRSDEGAVCLVLTKYRERRKAQK